MIKRRQFLKIGSTGIAASVAMLSGFKTFAQSVERTEAPFRFSEDGSQFLLHQKPFQIRSGEMHPARIPHQYWLHRIQMAKAMGMNTIAIYMIWNFHETTEGVFDFTSPSHDIAEFIRLCQQEHMWVLLRAGPYVCGEWDNGGIPSYLLKTPRTPLRANSLKAPRYMAAATRYLERIAAIAKPLMIANGGPILMVQIENEFGSFASDTRYLEELRQCWLAQGITGPFYTQDGLPQLRENSTSISGAAIGLSGGELADVIAVRKQYPGAPAMCGELYPGWLTHWGEAKLQGTDVDISSTLQDFMRHRISFNIYVIHGGTSFGFNAGANTEARYIQPDITSYDYAAPISEQGAPTKAYFKYRRLIQAALHEPLPPVPNAIPTLNWRAYPHLMPTLFASLWDNLPEPIKTVELNNFEDLNQSGAYVLHRKQLTGARHAHLIAPQINDYATVFIDDRYVGGFSRVKLSHVQIVKHHLQLNNRPTPPSLALQAETENPMLDVLVESLGHINYGAELGDNKGVVKPLMLQTSSTGGGIASQALTDWLTYLLPMDSSYIQHLRPIVTKENKAGLFFRLTLNLDEVADTYIDVSHWTKGVVWVNGHNLGRYWYIGPQKRLYCPATWLQQGANDIIIFDLHQTNAAPIFLADKLA